MDNKIKKTGGFDDDIPAEAVNTLPEGTPAEAADNIPEENGGISEQQIEQWKAKHEDIHRIRVVKGGVRYVGYFREPDFDVMSAAQAVTKQSGELKGSEVLFENTWLGGAGKMQRNAIIKVAALKEIGGLFLSCTTDIKNL